MKRTVKKLNINQDWNLWHKMVYDKLGCHEWESFMIESCQNLYTQRLIAGSICWMCCVKKLCVVDSLSNSLILCGAPPPQTLSYLLDVKGCGLSYITKEITKHYEIESRRLKRIKTKLTVSQAISLAQYRYDKSHFTSTCIP